MHGDAGRLRVGRGARVISGVLRVDPLDCEDAGGGRQNARIGQKRRCPSVVPKWPPAIVVRLREQARIRRQQQPRRTHQLERVQAKAVIVLVGVGGRVAVTSVVLQAAMIMATTTPMVMITMMMVVMMVVVERPEVVQVHRDRSDTVVVVVVQCSGGSTGQGRSRCRLERRHRKAILLVKVYHVLLVVPATKEVSYDNILIQWFSKKKNYVFNPFKSSTGVATIQNNREPAGMIRHREIYEPWKLGLFWLLGVEIQA